MADYLRFEDILVLIQVCFKRRREPHDEQRTLQHKRTYRAYSHILTRSARRRQSLQANPFDHAVQCHKSKVPILVSGP